MPNLGYLLKTVIYKDFMKIFCKCYLIFDQLSQMSTCCWEDKFTLRKRNLMKIYKCVTDRNPKHSMRIFPVMKQSPFDSEVH